MRALTGATTTTTTTTDLMPWLSYTYRSRHVHCEGIFKRHGARGYRIPQTCMYFRVQPQYSLTTVVYEPRVYSSSCALPSRRRGAARRSHTKTATKSVTLYSRHGGCFAIATNSYLAHDAFQHISAWVAVSRTRGKYYTRGTICHYESSYSLTCVFFFLNSARALFWV